MDLRLCLDHRLELGLGLDLDLGHGLMGLKLSLR